MRGTHRAHCGEQRPQAVSADDSVFPTGIALVLTTLLIVVLAVQGNDEHN
jgi:hypothetical protein